MKKLVKYLICFFIPIIIFNLGLIINKIAPFGDYLITIYDSKVQYPGFFMGLNNFSFYSFNVGLGFNFYSTAAYYLLSPLNIIMKFANIFNYNTFYYILIILKIGLCSTSMFFFLDKEIKEKTSLKIICSIIYSLIGYISSYYYNIFWIDSCILLPLVLYGINNIFDKNKPLIYMISLSSIIIINFYTGYMVGIFSIIYFIFKCIEKNNGNKIKMFVISSILSILISSFILIPTFFALIQGKATTYLDHDFVKYLAFNKNILYFPYSLTPGNLSSRQIAYGFGQNFCTLFILINFILFFFNKKFSKKLKLTTIIIFIFYLICFSFNLFDFAWQFFQRPIWWQHRYSFTLSFFMIYVAFKNLSSIETLKINTKQKIFIFAALSILIISSFIFFYISTTPKNIYRIFILIFSILLILNYLFIIESQNKTSKIIILILIFLELILNTFICIKENNNKSSIKYDIAEKTKIQNTINCIKNSDKDFYRLENINSFSANDGLLFNYNGVNYFNSVRNKNIMNTLEYTFSQSVESHSNVKLTNIDPYFTSLINLKYIIGSNELPFYQKYNNYSFKNNTTLSLGFMVDKKFAKLNLKDSTNYFNNITDIYNTMLNKNTIIYENLKPTIKLNNLELDKNKKYYQKIDKNNMSSVILEYKATNNMFIYPTYKYYKNYSKAYINNEEQKVNYSFIYLKKGDKLRIENSVIEENDINLNISSLKYSLEKELVNITNTLNKNNLKNIKVNNNHVLEASINVEKDDLLFTSIPYEKGMIIKVDNKKVKPVIIMNSFVGINLPKGKHKIIIDYIPRGLMPGIALSITSLFLFFLYIIKNK